MEIMPVNYRLEFEPDLKRAKFSGSEVLTADAGGRAGPFWLHSAELDVSSCSVRQGGDQIPCSFRADPKSEKIHVSPRRPVRGRFELHLRFEGILNDRLLGFYLSRYRQGGREQSMATTQFEAADARRAFPCIDEPAAKATFDISISAPKGLEAVSNMPVASRRKKGGRTVHRFETTPVMSTYLVYLAVGRFEQVSARHGKVRVRVLTVPGNGERGRFALRLAVRLLAEYEKYFGIKYPLPKLDLLAVPDFAAGAMENWGAITFRETLLLYDPKTSSSRTRQLIAEVVSHELAHQWFGNLVTMEWWNDLWLNESFATFMATKFVDKLYPEWDLWDQFLEDAMNTAMDLDALESTHPIDVEVKSPAQIREIFDAISYDKGGCILRMLERHVGEPKFRRGLREYLRRFRYGNASGDDLWRAIGRASGSSVLPLVRGWLERPGFPLVEARQSGPRVTLSQRRFRLLPARAGGTWQIPVEVAGRRILLKEKSRALRAPRHSDVLLNPGRHGFYRAKYDGGIMLDLKMLADSKKMPHVDRWAVQNDLYALCLAGQARVGEYLDFADACLGDASPLVAGDVSRNLYSAYMACFGEPWAEALRAYARIHASKSLARLGWEPRRGERQTEALLRASLIPMLARLGDARVAERAQGLLGPLLRGRSGLHPDLHEPVMSAAAWAGGRGMHAGLERAHRRAGTQEQKVRVLSAMCSFGDAGLLRRTLDFSRTPEVRSQNIHLPVMRVAANPRGRKVLWPWVRKHWTELSGKVGRGNPLLARVVSSVGTASGPEDEARVRRFFKSHPVPGTERALEQAMERMRARARLRESAKREFGA